MSPPAGVLGRRGFLAAAGLALIAGCAAAPTRPATAPPGSDPSPTGSPATTPTPAPSETPPPSPTPGTAQEMLARSVVPVLCFHQLREHRPGDSAYARTLITAPGVFAAQLQALKDAGYSTVTGDALADHVELGTPLPPRPVALTFDDGSHTHHSVALPALQRLGFTGTFFPMTVVLNKAGWLSDDQLRELDRAGMSIGAHTWDHQRLDRLPGDQWGTQLGGPKEKLAEVLGHPVDLLAYPNGLWTQEALAQVAAAGYRAAFQLADAADPDQPLLTIRRIMPPPTWGAATLLAHLESDF